MKGEALETLAQCPSGDYRFPYRVRSSPFRTLYGALRWKGVYKLDLNCFTTIVCTDLFDKTRAQLRGGRQGWVKEDKEGGRRRRRRRNRRKTKGVEGRLSSSSFSSTSLFHCQFSLLSRIDLCPAFRRPIKSPSSSLPSVLRLSVLTPTPLFQPRFASS